jgi:1-acyl-sn-glycerol-3-phosphate acyltransferase
MSEAAGTLFIERGGNQSAHITEIMRERLGGGCSVLFFPEGTTTDGREVRRFHPRLFAPAQDAGALLQPVALAYRPHPGRDDVAPFIGDDAFMPHLIRVLAEPGLGVQVRFLDPLEAAGRPRRRLAEYTREAIRGALGCGPGDAKAAEERGRRKERRTVQG